MNAIRTFILIFINKIRSQNIAAVADHSADRRYLVDNLNCRKKPCPADEKYAAKRDDDQVNKNPEKRTTTASTLVEKLRSKRSPNRSSQRKVVRPRMRTNNNDAEQVTSDYYELYQRSKRARKPWIMGPEDYAMEGKRPDRPDVNLADSEIEKVNQNLLDETADSDPRNGREENGREFQDAYSNYGENSDAYGTRY